MHRFPCEKWTMLQIVFRLAMLAKKVYFKLTASNVARSPLLHLAQCYLYAPLCNKDVRALLDGSLKAARKGEVVLRPDRITHVDTAYITGVCKERRLSVIFYSMPGVLWI